MISSTRLVLALAAMGLAAPAAADGVAPPVLANTDLDVLTASTVLSAGRGAGAAAHSASAIDASGLARDVAQGLSSGLWTPRGRIGEGAGSARGHAASAPSAAGVAGQASSAAGSVLGGSIGRSATARSADSVGTAAATAAGAGLSSVRLAAQSAPGLASSVSRSASLSSR